MAFAIDRTRTSITWLVFSLLRAREFRRVNTSELAPNLEHELLDAIVETLRPR